MQNIFNKTVFPKKEYHCPKIIILDATHKTLGRFATEISVLLKGTYLSFYTPWVNQGNFIIVLNAKSIKLSGNKENKKFYYKNSQRPGSLKQEKLQELRSRLPSRILSRAVWGMLPKGVLGRQIFKRLYIYKENKIIYKNSHKSSVFLKTLLKNSFVKYD